MTAQRDVEDFARWMWERDWAQKAPLNGRTPDNYLNEAAIFLAGELGQRLQHGQRDKISRTPGPP